MVVQLTDAGSALLDANTGPITLTAFKLGSAYGYIPNPADTNIHGTVVYQGVPSAPAASNANVVKYSIYLDYDLGNFAFGEVALFAGNTLFALASGSDLTYKVALTSVGAGNSIRLDLYLSMVNSNYDMWLDYAESNNQFRAAVLGSVDQLPPPQQATPNMYVIQGATVAQSSFLAYTDRAGLWNFDCYEYANQATGTVIARDAMSVTLALSDYKDGMSPAYFGSTVLEFSTGALFGICRYVRSAIKNSSTVVIGFQNRLNVLPAVGDKVVFFGRQALSTTIPNLPIASHDNLGAVIIGSTLQVGLDGTVDVAPGNYPVTSVNDKTGDVDLTATDIPGFATVATTGKYGDLIGAPSVYTLPVATKTVVGGVKAPTDSTNLVIAGDGTINLTFDPVKTVNGITPDPSTGDVAVPVPVATQTVLGGVKASTDITVDENGVMGLGFVAVRTVNGASPDSSGAVNVPASIGLVVPTKLSGIDLNTVQTTGLYFVLDADVAGVTNMPGSAGGTLDVEPFTTTASGGDVIQRLQTATTIYFRRLTKSNNTWSTWVSVASTASLPIATPVSVGVVKVGSGLSIDGTGNLTANVTSVNGQAGLVELAASDVGALASSVVGADGGVPQLDSALEPPANPDTDPYTFGRMRFNQITLGSWWNAGTWDASANSVTVTGQTNVIGGQQLLANGQQTIDITYDGLVSQNGTSPNIQTVSGEGMVYRVTVAGSTALDGTSQWDVGDLVVAVAGKWTKITVNFNNIVLGAGTF